MKFIDQNIFGYGSDGGGLSYSLSFLGIFIPSILVAARRLHDTNKSGWRLLWSFTGIGAFFVLYWLMIKLMNLVNTIRKG